MTNGKVATNYFVSGSGETVVLLPGFCRSVSDYNELVASLNGVGYRTVGIQPRGVGQSTSPVFPRASIHDLATDVAHVVEDLNQSAGGKVHVVGRAFGARIARVLAADYPQLVQSAILLAGGGAIGIAKWKLLRYAISNLRFVPQGLRRRMQRALLCAPGNEAPRSLSYRQPLGAVRRQFAALRTPVEEIWRGGRTPILWIHGEQDALVPVAQVRALCEKFPDQVELVVIPGAAHALLPEQPELVLKAITTFLQKHAISDHSD